MAWRFVDEEPQEGTLKTVGKESLRHGARTLSNIGTRAIGTPGDILSLTNELISLGSEVITGKKGLPYEETFLGKLIPTTEMHRKGLESASGEYLKPQNKIEKFSDDFLEDALMFLNPSEMVKKGVKILPKVFKSMAKSFGANLAGETIESVSGSEQAGTWTKAGALFLGSLLDKESAAKQVSRLYKNAEKNLPPNAVINATKFSKQLDTLQHKITKGRPLENLSAGEKFVINQIDKARNLIKDGNVNIEQVWAQKRSLNSDLSTLFKEVPRKSEQKSVRNLAKQVNGYLNNAIEDYGKTNPKFYKDFKGADEAYGTLAKSKFISNWIESNITNTPLTHGLLHILGVTIPGAVTGMAIPYQGARLLYRINKSPTLRKIYGNTLKAAAKEDALLFNKYLNELDNEFQKEEGKETWRFVD